MYTQAWTPHLAPRQYDVESPSPLAQLGALKAAHTALLELDARVIGFPEAMS